MRYGDLVRYYCFTARVVAFHRETGEPILRDVKDGTRWLAHGDLCEVIGSMEEISPALDYSGPGFPSRHPEYLGRFSTTVQGTDESAGGKPVELNINFIVVED